MGCSTCYRSAIPSSAGLRTHVCVVSAEMDLQECSAEATELPILTSNLVSAACSVRRRATRTLLEPYCNMHASQ